METFIPTSNSSIAKPTTTCAGRPGPSRGEMQPLHEALEYPLRLNQTWLNPSHYGWEHILHGSVYRA